MQHAEPGKQQSSDKVHLQFLWHGDLAIVAENNKKLFNAVSVMG